MILADISTFLSNQNHFTQLKMFLKIKKNSNLQDLSLEFKDEMSPTEKYNTVSSQILQLSRQQLEAKEHNGKGKVQLIRDQVVILALPLTNCMTLSKFHHHFVPWLTHF